MAVIGLQSAKWKNNFRIILLILLMPVLVLAVEYVFFLWVNCPVGAVCKTSEGIEFIGTTTAWQSTIQALIWQIPILLLWLWIGIWMQKEIIFSLTSAEEVTRKTHPEIYNIVENLAISRGLPVPKIGIIHDDSINAFATGWNPKKSYIVFSTGLLERLDDREIEAVAGHELTHIINQDVRVMVIINVFIGIIGTIGYFLMRSGWQSNNNNNKDSKGGGALILLGLALYLLSLIVLPLINLAVSRKKEFLADAGSVELTKDTHAMISALKKISQDSHIELVDAQSRGIRAMFINNPGKKERSGKKKKSFFGDIFSTHPSIEDRIAMLEKY